MATTKVSALPAKTSLGGSEELLINDGGTSKKVTATNLLSGASVADGSISTAKIADDAVTEAKLANAINTAIAANTAKTGITTSQANAITANTAKVTNATHTGDVTGATALTIAADAVTTAKILDDAVTADKLANSINTDIATGVTANTTADAALPKSGGTMTGDLAHADNIKSKFGASDDLEIYHENTNHNSFIHETGSGSLYIRATDLILKSGADNDDMAKFIENGAAQLYYSNAKKIETTANGVTVTGTAVATTDTDATNTGSVTLDFAANQNFVLTLTGNVTLANPSTEQVGQSGFITFIQDGTGSRTVSLGTDYETAGGAGLTLTSTASATDIVPYVVVASGRILLGTPQLAFA